VVDEAQDCSTADLYILNKLYDVGLPLVVVADPDQAIYGFRGAATHALTSLAGRLGRHDLTHNWRSTTVICKVAATLRRDPARRAADIAVACHHDAPHPVIVYAGGDRDANTADFIGYATKLDISPGDCLVLAHAQTTLPKTYAGVEGRAALAWAVGIITGFKRHDTSGSERSMKMDSAPPPAHHLSRTPAAACPHPHTLSWMP
jgi:DNA helicase II / ATP-dependent DNA helicase PcrA